MPRELEEPLSLSLLMRVTVSRAQSHLAGLKIDALPGALPSPWSRSPASRAMAMIGETAECQCSLLILNPCSAVSPRQT